MDAFLQAPPNRGTRREALPRRTAVNTPGGLGRPSEAPGGGFFGFQQVAEESSDEDTWYLPAEEQTTLAGPFKDTHVLMTDTNFSKERKWCDTKIHGNLSLVQVKTVGHLPIVLLRLKATDRADIERKVVLEYELPLNFSYEGELSTNFVAVSLMKGEFLGFYFAERADKDVFAASLESLSLKLCVSQSGMAEISSTAKEIQDQEFQDQLAEAISLDNLMNEQDENQQAIELRKILILAGLKVD